MMLAQLRIMQKKLVESNSPGDGGFPGAVYVGRSRPTKLGAISRCFCHDRRRR
jgi:hypothetical protein